MGLTNKLNLKEGTPAAPSGCLFPEMERGKWGMERELAQQHVLKIWGGGGVSCIRVILLLFPPN